MTSAKNATTLGDSMMLAAGQWLEVHEGSDEHKDVIGIVVSVCPEEDGTAEFVVGATHDITNEAIVEILLRVMNNLIPPESQLRMVVTPKSGGQG